MKNKVLDLAMSINDFKHMNELMVAIDSELQLMKSDTDLVLHGFYLVLSELQKDSTLQRVSLLSTMLEVKKRYGVLTMFKHTAIDMCGITLAINHVRMLLKLKRLKQKHGCVA
ncbi:hypothetical protein [Priestia megaterium]|uniref:hypothetical protein n=1 Tax=Priestia megaterium TaxID=1404 RepID=UPI0032D954CB